MFRVDSYWPAQIIDLYFNVYFFKSMSSNNIEPFLMGFACPRGLWPFTLMRRKEHAKDCNHFYIILGQRCIIRKGWFPWPQWGLKLQAFPQPGFRKVTEIALASFCPCVPLRYKVMVRWQSSNRDTLQPIHQYLNGQLLCGASCFQNQLPKLQLSP